MNRISPRHSRLLRYALPVAALAALVLSVPLAAQSKPQVPPEEQRRDEAAGTKADTAGTASDSARAKGEDAERRKPKRDGERKPLPEREREEEDDGRR